MFERLIDLGNKHLYDSDQLNSLDLMLRPTDYNSLVGPGILVLDDRCFARYPITLHLPLCWLRVSYLDALPDPSEPDWDRQQLPSSLHNLACQKPGRNR